MLENDQAHEVTSMLIKRLKVHLSIAGDIIPPRGDFPVLDEIELYKRTYKHALEMLDSQEL